MRLLSIDPGTNSPGVAASSDTRIIACANLVLPPEWVALPDEKRWPRIAGVVFDWTRDNVGAVDEIVFERPQWYQRKTGGSKGDPNKLAGVLAVAAISFGMLTRYATPKLTLYTPAEWIGQLTKECPACEAKRARRKGTKTRTYAKDCEVCHGSAWLTPRGRFIRSKLYPDELAIIPDQNDAIDAAGILLKRLGRLVPTRVFSNGRD